MVFLCYFILYFMAFIFGICIGSFLNVVIYRVPNGISIAKGRSFCPECKTQIKNYDLIPVLSWILLKGICRNCGGKISIRYPVVELLGGVVAVLTFLCYGFTLKSFVAFILFAILICIAYVDYDSMEIPDSILYSLAVPCIASFFVFKEISIKERIIGLLCVSGFLLIMSLLIKGSFGLGDVILMAFAGFFTGYKNIILAFFIGIVVSGLYAITKIITKKLKGKDHMSFGPGLCLGIFIAQLYGDKIIDFYLHICGLR